MSQNKVLLTILLLRGWVFPVFVKLQESGIASLLTRRKKRKKEKTLRKKQPRRQFKVSVVLHLDDNILKILDPCLRKDISLLSADYYVHNIFMWTKNNNSSISMIIDCVWLNTGLQSWLRCPLYVMERGVRLSVGRHELLLYGFGAFFSSAAGFGNNSPAVL